MKKLSRVFLVFFIALIINSPSVVLALGEYNGVWAGTQNTNFAGQTTSERTWSVLFQENENTLSSFDELLGTVQLVKSGSQWILPSPIVNTYFGINITINNVSLNFTTASTMTGTIGFTGNGITGTSTLSPSKLSCQILSNGVAVNNLSGGVDSYQCFEIVMPLGSTNLNVQTTMGAGDCDLELIYYRPNFDYYYSDNFGNNENITVNSPNAGKSYIVLYGFESYSGLELLASYDDPIDNDSDGFKSDEDCNDNDSSIYPGANEVPDDGVDQDCNGFDTITCTLDSDMDGFGTDVGTSVLSIDGACDTSDKESNNQNDCNDNDANINPGFQEICDGQDNDCDGIVPLTETDDDGDGLAECEGDCLDTDQTVYQGAPELCDGLDNDCDGQVPADEADADTDGFPMICAGDCNDNDDTVYPGAPELCDGLDNDCDGQVPADEDYIDGNVLSIIADEMHRTDCSVVTPCTMDIDSDNDVDETDLTMFSNYFGTRRTCQISFGFLLPDTGQNTSYTNTFGEDSDYTINPPSYTLNTDGTTTDNVTGLMWQSSDDNIQYNWYEASGTADDDHNLGGATDVCGSLTLAGHNDWRLTTENELQLIVNYETNDPAIDQTFFPGTESTFYWSATTSTSLSSYAWFVNFRNGFVSYRDKTNSNYVRCVRGARKTAYLGCWVWVTVGSL